MTLKEYLDSHAISAADFAKSIDVKTWTVNRYIGNKQIPAKEIMKKIKNTTGGTVTADSFYE